MQPIISSHTSHSQVISRVKYADARLNSGVPMIGHGKACLGALWFVRWLLVLVLIWDQVGSPLHDHHHDSGVDAQWLSAAPHSDSPVTAHSVDGDDDLRISHAVMAVRPQVDLGSLVLGGSPDDGLIHRLAFSAVAAEPAGPVMATAGPTTPRRIHRSLPPAGRAPPLHT